MRKSGSYIKTEIAVSDLDVKLAPILGTKANPYIIYLKMRLKIIRSGWKDHKDYPIKKDYYDKGYLAMTMSIGQMAEEFGVNKNSISKAIHLLNKYGWIRINKLKTKKNFKAQYVYIFGTWRKQGDRTEEIYYNSPFF